MSKLKKFDDPALKTVCEPLTVGESLAFVDDMRRVCHEENGVGLAAPQIGVMKRAVFVWPRRQGGESVVMLNPKVIEFGQLKNTESEGCLSYPGVFIPIERHTLVTLEYLDTEWKSRRRQFSFFAARVVQHEMDHLDGLCRVGDSWRANRAMKAEAEPSPAIYRRHPHMLPLAMLMALTGIPRR